MNLREAAQQALEALERLDEQELETGDIAWLGKEIGDLRVALSDTQDWSEIEALRASLREHMAEIHRLRASGRQALEALEQCGLNDERRSYEFEHATRVALRAALSEDAMQRLTDEQQMIERGNEYVTDGHENADDHIADTSKMVEPVATLNETETVAPVAWCIVENGRVKGLVKSKPAVMNADLWQPLYTVIPKREPLTDDQISEIFISHGRDKETFARAIERAHGIGGEK